MMEAETGVVHINSFNKRLENKKRLPKGFNLEEFRN